MSIIKEVKLKSARYVATAYTIEVQEAITYIDNGVRGPEQYHRYVCVPTDVIDADEYAEVKALCSVFANRNG